MSECDKKILLNAAELLILDKLIPIINATKSLECLTDKNEYQPLLEKIDRAGFIEKDLKKIILQGINYLGLVLILITLYLLRMNIVVWQYLVLFFYCITHELGHFLAGKLFGIRMLGLKICPPFTGESSIFLADFSFLTPIKQLIIVLAGIAWGILCLLCVGAVSVAFKLPKKFIFAIFTVIAYALLDAFIIGSKSDVYQAKIVLRHGEISYFDYSQSQKNSENTYHLWFTDCLKILLFISGVIFTCAEYFIYLTSV